MRSENPGYKAKRVNWRELPKEEWWVEGDLIHEPYGTVIQYYEDEIKDKGNCAKTSKKKRIKAVVEPETVCEYTGSTDENGRKIFEGDICQNNNNVVHVLWSNKHQWGVEIRKTDNALCRGRTIPLWLYDNRNGRTLEVIGNIFDNIGLLEGGEVE